MSEKFLRTVLATLAALAAGMAWSADREPIQPIQAVRPKDAALVELGKQLFFDPRLSKSGFISCNSCHDLSLGGASNLKTPVGHRWSEGRLNAPTVLNAGMNVAQFWDGRVDDLKSQAAEHMASSNEMGTSHALTLEVLQSIPGYVRQFRKIFGNAKPGMEEVTRALAAFEETLVTPNSRFDKWLRGDRKALTGEELAGYRLFRESGCTACHNGPAVGGNAFHRMGTAEPYKGYNPDEGRYAVTRKEADRFSFKVPTLRNVELTAPYFHDGSANTLKEAVDTMGRIQLGKNFSEEENARIVAFLKTLTGDQPSFRLPILPASSDSTPRPKPFAR